MAFDFVEYFDVLTVLPRGVRKPPMEKIVPRRMLLLRSAELLARSLMCDRALSVAKNELA